MRREIIDLLLREKKLRARKPDYEKIKTLVQSARQNSAVVLAIDLTSKTSTVVFRELYESIRQLGEAQWLSQGFEPTNHEISLESLTTLDIKHKSLLNHLNRYRKIRNDANYSGFTVTLEQAKSMLEFWNSCSKDIIKIIATQLRT